MEFMDRYADTSIDPCSGGAHPFICYRYWIREKYDLREDEHQEARRFCMTLRGEGRKGCFHGIGFGSTAKLLRDSASIETICRASVAADRQACIEGAVETMSLALKPDYTFFNHLKPQIPPP